MKTYLVTGGAGFIGSHLAEALLSNGDGALVLDDLSTGRLANIAHLRDHPRFEFIEGSVCDASVLSEAVARCEGVFHLAAAVGVRLIMQHPVKTIKTNVQGTESVLEAASGRGVPVLVASSSEVYGKAHTVPFSEDDTLLLGNTRTLRWAYGCSKALDEFLAMAYACERGLPTIVVRLFNTAGPRQTDRYGMVLPTFARQAVANEPITVHGDGKQRRCFCHVQDVVGALVRLIEHPGAIGNVFNIGGTEEVTIGELAVRVKALAASHSDIVYIPYADAWDERFEDMQRRIPDLTRIRQLIGFESGVSLDEIIVSVLAHARAV